MAKFPTYEQIAKNVAEKALDEFLYDGKSIREWMKIIAEQEKKSGKWIDIDEEPHEDYECSCCGHVVSTFSANIEPHTEYKYCPNCGVKMVDPQERSNKCSKCEYHINPDYTRCKECGAERSDKE